MALGFCAATVYALVLGGTRDGETAALGLQMAVTLAMLGILWALIGIMFTLARPGQQHGPHDGPPATATGEPRRVNWFQDANANAAGGAPRR